MGPFPLLLFDDDNLVNLFTLILGLLLRVYAPERESSGACALNNKLLVCLLKKLIWFIFIVQFVVDYEFFRFLYIRLIVLIVAGLFTADAPYRNRPDRWFSLLRGWKLRYGFDTEHTVFLNYVYDPVCDC